MPRAPAHSRAFSMSSTPPAWPKPSSPQGYYEHSPPPLHWRLLRAISLRKSISVLVSIFVLSSLAFLSLDNTSYIRDISIPKFIKSPVVPAQNNDTTSHVDSVLDFPPASPPLPPVFDAVSSIPKPAPAIPVSPPPEPVNPWATSNFVKGSPTPAFRDNLKPDQKYITTFLGGGWTNDVLTYMNLIYLGLLTQRVPIVGVFSPSHIGYAEAYLPVRDVFDLDGLAKTIRLGIVTWEDVKDAPPTNVTARVKDELGCWSVYQTMGPDGKPRSHQLRDHYNLDVSFTPVPESVKLTTLTGESWGHASFSHLVPLTFPETRHEHLAYLSQLPTNNLTAHQIIHPTPHSKKIVPPDEQTACFDFIYFVGSAKAFEWDSDYYPVWRFVGTHMKWRPALVENTNGYLRRIFSVQRNEDIPPFISIHVRRQDFIEHCNALHVPGPECLPALPDFRRRVTDVQAALKKKLGLDVEKVVVTSDERDEEWWKTVKEYGWLWPDHSAKGEHTVKKMGKWGPILIDAVIQSLGTGFVGTDGSTMSVIAGRRVREWNNGASYLVRWGYTDKDRVHEPNTVQTS